MLNILYFTDPHITKEPPACRKPGYYESVLNKIRIIIETVNKEYASAVLIGGDIFHRKGHAPNTPEVINDILDILMQSRAPVFAVAGNHDISAGSSSENLHNQTLGILEKAKALTILDGTNPVSITNNDTPFAVSISGRPYIPAMDSPEGADLYNVRHKDSPIRIGLFHQMLFPDNLSVPAGACIHFEDLQHINSNVVLTGHYHTGFEPEYAYGRMFANTGSLGRVSVKETHMPKYAKILISNEYPEDVLIQYENVKAANSAQFVFVNRNTSGETVEYSNLYANSSAEIKNFVKSLSGFDAFNASDKTADDIIRMLINDYGMPERMETSARAYLQI